jgi:hypothetical protein
MSDLTANLTLEQTATILGIEPAAVTRLATGARPKIGSLKIGRVRVFPPAVVEAYIETNTTQAAPPNPWGLTDSAAKRLRKTG